MDKMNLIVRPETPQDYPKIYTLNNLAFRGSTEAELVDRLRNTKAFLNELSLVATIENNLVGHILLSEIEVVNETSRNIGLSLAPMAVEPSYQKQGIGSRLVREALEQAKSIGYKFVVVLGHETFYPKFGFRPARNWNIKAPFNAPENYFMAIELEYKALDGVSGIVQYPKEFII